MPCITHTIIDHEGSLCSCCLDCLEDVHTSFNFDPLNFSHTSDEHTTAGHTVTERGMSNKDRQRAWSVASVHTYTYTHTWAHSHTHIFTHMHAYAIVHTNTCMHAQTYTHYWLTRTWPSEVPWCPASSPLDPSSSAWSQLEDGPPLARRGSGTGSPQRETQSSANNRPCMKRNKYKLIGHSFTFFKVYVYDILYFKHSLGNDCMHTHMCTDYDTHKAEAIKYIRLKNWYKIYIALSCAYVPCCFVPLAWWSSPSQDGEWCQCGLSSGAHTSQSELIHLARTCSMTAESVNTTNYRKT